MEHLIPVELQQIINSEIAYKYRIIPISKKSENISFITDHSELNSLINELEVIFNTQIILKTVKTDELEKYLAINYRSKKDLKVSNLEYSNDFLEKIVITAKQIGSSDIHFEPYENKCRIRYRIDGKLKEQFIISQEEYPILLNKIKIKAQLDISEKRLPQDGRITITTEYDDFDIRVSILPTLYGEKAVLRILSKDTSHINIENLGFNTKELETFLENIKKPNGIILISGPTGSGKTTTLYATLKLLNQSNTNILTVEDPIEYTLEGVNQVQLKENIGLDFASTLRTFLRQDPDIIMVGEIRDVNTANMAVRAALTGHLVLSTIHTNSAWATISRLIDMGVPPFLIANTLNCSIAQRLVRKLCPICKEQSSIDTSIFPTGFSIPDNLKTHYLAKGCNSCHHTGYSGRKAIYEILTIDKELIQHIKNNTTSIEDYIDQNKITTLRSNAIEMISHGETSVEEVFSLLMI
jgi:type IV pilus assembly protein PilB